MNELLRNQLFPAKIDFAHVFLKPAELHIAKKPTIITTLLGSCVALVFFAPDHRVCAVCHCMLPYEIDTRRQGEAMFVDSSIGRINDYFKQHYCDLKKVQVKLFGGADQSSFLKQENSFLSVGRQNIRAALDCLANCDFVLMSKAVGGLKGYKIYVRSDTGLVWMTRIGKKQR